MLSLGLGFNAQLGVENLSRSVLRKYGTLSHLWDFGVSQNALTYAATHKAAEFVAAYPLWHLYQDAAGSVPACKPTDPVGLCLDQPTGVVTLGPELVGGFVFDRLDTGWSGAGPSTANYTSTGVTGFAGSTNPLTIDKFYKYVYEIVSCTSGSVRIQNGSTFGDAYHTTPGVVTVMGVANSDAIYFLSKVFVGVVRLISVREVIGAHARQTTPTKRPILSGRVNLLTATEDFASASWTKNNVTSTSNTLVASAVSSSHGVAQSTLTVGVAYTLRCKFKANGYIGACISNAGSPLYTATINLNTGNITSGASITSATSELQPDGYWLLTCSFTAGYTTVSIFISSNGTSVNTFFGE